MMVGGNHDKSGEVYRSITGAYFGLKQIPNDLTKLNKKYKKVLKKYQKFYNKCMESFKNNHYK